MTRRCVIIGGGDCSKEIIESNVTENDFIICADSGYDFVIKTHFSPDLLIGDFDSIKSSICENQKNIKLPVEKDVTDTEAALNYAIDLGYKDFLILGGTGGRFEHTFANISLICKCANSQLNCVMSDEKHKYMSIHNSKKEIDYKENQQISVFAFGEKAYGVTEEGFHYTIKDYTLNPFEPLGISNDIISDKGIISVKNGTLLIIETKM